MILIYFLGIFLGPKIAFSASNCRDYTLSSHLQFILLFCSVLVREIIPKNRLGSLFSMYLGPEPRKGRNVCPKPWKSSRVLKRRRKRDWRIFSSSGGRSTYVYFIDLVMLCSSKLLRLMSCYHRVALVSVRQPTTWVCRESGWRSPSWTFPLRYICLLWISKVCISHVWVL